MRLSSKILLLMLISSSAFAQDISQPSNSPPTTGEGKMVLNRNPVLEAPELGIAKATSLILQSFLKLNATAVGSLPKCTPETLGYKYAVVDAKEPVALSEVIGSGDNVVSVFCNGAKWIIN